MRARVVAGFALGFALGLLVLGLGLWFVGALRVGPPSPLQVAATQRAQAAKPSPAIGTPTDEPERGAPLPLDQQHVTQNIIPPQPQAPATAQQQVAPAPQLPSPPAAQQGPPKIQDEADRVILDPKLQHLRMPLDGVDPSDLAD